MSKNPSNVSFTQPSHGTGKTSSAKNKSKVGFVQPNKGTGKNKSGMMNVPGKVPFSQPNHGVTKSSTKKNPGKVGFDQPNPAKKTTAMPKYEGKNVGKGAKIRPAKDVAPKAGFKSTEDLVKFRRKKYGV